MQGTRFDDILSVLDQLEREVKELSRLETQELAAVQMYDNMMAQEDNQMRSHNSRICQKREELNQNKERERFLREGIDNIGKANSVLQDMELQAENNLKDQRNKVNTFKDELHQKLSDTKDRVNEVIDVRRKDPTLNAIDEANEALRREESRGEYLLEQKKIKEEKDSIISDWPLFVQNCLEFADVYLKSTDLHARNEKLKQLIASRKATVQPPQPRKSMTTEIALEKMRGFNQKSSGPSVAQGSAPNYMKSSGRVSVGNSGNLALGRVTSAVNKLSASNGSRGKEGCNNGNKANSIGNIVSGRGSVNSFGQGIAVTNKETFNKAGKEALGQDEAARKTACNIAANKTVSGRVEASKQPINKVGSVGKQTFSKVETSHHNTFNKSASEDRARANKDTFDRAEAAANQRDALNKKADIKKTKDFIEASVRFQTSDPKKSTSGEGLKPVELSSGLSLSVTSPGTVRRVWGDVLGRQSGAAMNHNQASFGQRKAQATTPATHQKQMNNKMNGNDDNNQYKQDNYVSPVRVNPANQNPIESQHKNSMGMRAAVDQNRPRQSQPMVSRVSTPPIGQRVSTPPTVQRVSTPPTVQRVSTPPTVQRVSTPPTLQAANTSLNRLQCNTPPANQNVRTNPTLQQVSSLEDILEERARSPLSNTVTRDNQNENKNKSCKADKEASKMVPTKETASRTSNENIVVDTAGVDNDNITTITAEDKVEEIENQSMKADITENENEDMNEAGENEVTRMNTDVMSPENRNENDASYQIRSLEESTLGSKAIIPPTPNTFMRQIKAGLEVMRPSIFRKGPTSSSEIMQGATPSSEIKQNATSSSEMKQGVTSTSEIKQGVTSTSEIKQGVTSTSEIKQGVKAGKRLSRTSLRSVGSVGSGVLAPPNTPALLNQTSEQLKESFMEQETSFVNEDIPEETDEEDLDNQHAMHATENYEHGDELSKDVVVGDKDRETKTEDDLMNGDPENIKNYENDDTANIPNGAGSIIEDSIDTEEQHVLGNAGNKSSSYTDDQYTNVDDDYDEHANADEASFKNHSIEGYQDDSTYLKDKTDERTNEGYAAPNMACYDNTKPVSHDSFENESAKSPKDNFEQVTSAEMVDTEEVNYCGDTFSKATVGGDTSNTLNDVMDASHTPNDGKDGSCTPNDGKDGSYTPNDGMDTCNAPNDDEQAVSEEMRGLNCADRSPGEKEKLVRGIGLQRQGKQVLSPRTQNPTATHDLRLQNRSPYPPRGIVSTPAPSPRYWVPNSQAEAVCSQGAAAYPQGAAMYPQGTATYPQGAAMYPQGAAAYLQGAAMFPQGANMRLQTSKGAVGYPQGSAMYHPGGSAYPSKGNMEMSANNCQTPENHQQPYGMMHNNGQFVQGHKTEMLPQSGANPTAPEHTFAVPTGDYSMRPSGRQTEKDFPQQFCREDTENYDKQSKNELSENVDDRNDSFQMEEPLSTQEQNIKDPDEEANYTQEEGGKDDDEEEGEGCEESFDLRSAHGSGVFSFTAGSPSQSNNGAGFFDFGEGDGKQEEEPFAFFQADDAEGSISNDGSCTAFNFNFEGEEKPKKEDGGFFPFF